MSKGLKYQIEFASVGGKKYRIDIYKEGWDESSPIRLLAGDSPLETKEDSSGDFFEALRNQTGTLQVCTSIPPQEAFPNGGLLNIADILPQNNIDCPVFLYEIAGEDQHDEIRWQGFLSCESYSQNYTGVPENISLNVNSVLNVMSSIELEQKENMSFNKLITIIADVLNTVEQKVGMSLFGQIFISDYCFDAITLLHVYNNSYFSLEEIVNGDDIVGEIHSSSCKEILEQIAKFFGCVWRESAGRIFLSKLAATDSYKYASVANVIDKYINNVEHTNLWSPNQIVSLNLNDQEWRGTDHKISVYQGRKRVAVEASLKEFELSMGLRECPVSAINANNENPSEMQETWDEVYFNPMEDFFNLAHHQHYKVRQQTYIDEYDGNKYKARVVPRWHDPDEGESPFIDAISADTTSFWLGTNQNFLQVYDSMIFQKVEKSVDLICTSWMGYVRNRESEGPLLVDKELMTGLMVVGLPNAFLTDPSGGGMWNEWFIEWGYNQYYVYDLSAGLNFTAENGKLKLELEISAVSTNRQTLYKEDFQSFVHTPGVALGIKIGNNWVKRVEGTDTYVFTDDFETIMVDTDNEGKAELEIQVNSVVDGVPHIYVYPITAGSTPDYTQTVQNVFITKMDLEYEPAELDWLQNNSTNYYSADTGVAFNDEERFSVQFASDVANAKRASLVYYADQKPVTLLSLANEMIRPEVALLRRLCAFYRNAQTQLTLKMKHPYSTPSGIYTEQNMPRVRFTDSGKTYLPLAESRNWHTEVCDMKLFEMPEEQSE